MGLNSGRSLKARIAGVAAALFVAGIALVTALVARLQQGEMEQMVSQQQLTAATYIARDIDGKIRLRLDSLVRVGSNVPRELIARPAALQQWLEDRRAIHTLFPNGLLIIPADGGPSLADAPRLQNRPKSFVDRDWFAQVKTTLKPAISRPLIARATNEPALVVAVPLLDGNGSLLAVLAGVTPLATPGFLDLIQDAGFGAHGRYQIISPAHRLFVLTSDSQAPVSPLPSRSDDAVLDRALDGGRGALLVGGNAPPELAAVVEIGRAGWLLVARQPTDEAYAPLRNSLRNTVLAALALAVPGILLLLAAVNRLLAPFSHLARQMHDMAEGAREMLPLPSHAADEVAEVVNSFNHLQQKLLDQENRLAELAHHDALTGLPNRLTIIDRLANELLRIRRNGEGLALLFLDLDGFKPVNDVHGHQVGDRLLVQIAQRLQACVRDVDTVARLGGDEFLILLTANEAPQEAAERVASQCLEAIALPFRVDSLRLTVGVSIGIAVAHGRSGVTAAQLIGHADLAMYQAKAAGRGRYAVYQPSSPESNP